MLTSCGRPLMLDPSLLRISAVYSDSDSEWSSLERRGAAAAGHESGDLAARPPRKSSSHKRPRRKRAAIPVATPRVPPLPSALHHNPPSGVPLPLSTRPRASDLAATVDKGIVVMQQHPIHPSSLSLSLSFSFSFSTDLSFIFALFPIFSLSLSPSLLHAVFFAIALLSSHWSSQFYQPFDYFLFYFRLEKLACLSRSTIPIPRLVLHQDLDTKAFLFDFLISCYSPFDAFLAMVCHSFITMSITFVIEGTLQLNAREPAYGAVPDEESSVDVPSPRDRDVGSPLVSFVRFGFHCSLGCFAFQTHAHASRVDLDFDGFTY